MKNYLITLFLTLIICVAITIVTLMTNVPQIDTDDLASVEKYLGIVESEFKFDNYKNINNDAMSKEYIVTAEQINKFKYTNSYKPGNSNPFTPKDDLDDSTNNNTDDDTDDKTDNSNGGQGNDSNSGK